LNIFFPQGKKEGRPIMQERREERWGEIVGKERWKWRTRVAVVERERVDEQVLKIP